jgi:hypothetical protein
MTNAKTPTFDNAKNAIRAAFARAPMVVAWVPNLSSWTIYHPSNPIPNAEPEILCLRTGLFPIPLSEDGADVLFSALQA